MAYAFMAIAAITFGAFRLAMPVKSEIHHEDLFKDAAHLYVGSLYGMSIGFYCAYRIIRTAVALFKSVLIDHGSDQVDFDFVLRLPGILKTWSKTMFWWGVGLTLLEIAAFIIHKQP